MNRIAKRFLIASLVTLSGVAFAATNKTHYQPRPANVNLAMERTTWHTQINKKIVKEDDKFGASLQAVGFYEASTNGNGMGKYFGFAGRRDLTVGAASSTVDGRIDRRNLLAMPATFGSVLAGTLALDFTYNQGGIRLDYFQDLDGILKGLYFHVNTPIVWSQTKSSIGLSSSTTQTAYGTAFPAQRSVADYFSGNITQTGESTQAALAYAKINGNKSKTSLADIDLKLGWNFWETEKHHAGINIAVTFPTGAKAKAVELFEPLGGSNGGHWGLGAGLDVAFQAWNDEEQNLEFEFVLNYRYLFSAKDTRTLGYRTSATATPENWGQYFLVAQVATAGYGVEPFANISTGRVNVKAGSQVDFLAGLTYNNGGFSFDLGYELYARENEKVTRKFDIQATTGLAGNDYSAGTAGTTAFTREYIPSSAVKIYQTYAGGQSATGTYLTNDNLATSVAETPSQFTNKIYAGLGYCWNEWETPLMLGLGGEYEFASTTKALSMWGIWAKIGISF
jgi:hypothetical protein